MDATLITKNEPIASIASSSNLPKVWSTLFASLPFLLFYLYRKLNQARFRNMRVPFVENCNFLLGNLADYVRTPMHIVHQQWSKKYGKTYCCFEGPAPVLITSDLNILREVLIKQFQNFSTRKDIPLVPDSDTHPYVHTFIADGARWKRLRQCSSAFFTTGRLRILQNLMNDCAEKFADQLAAVREPVDVFTAVSKEVYDLQQQVMLGKVEDTKKSKLAEKTVSRMMKDCLDPSKVPSVVAFGLIFPELKPFWFKMYHLLNKLKLQSLPGYQLFHFVKSEFPELLKSVKPSTTRCPTLLEYYSKLVTDPREAPLQRPTIRPEMTYSEMVSEVFIGFFTQPTFSLTFSMCLHLLAMHPKVQQRLQDEIDQAFASRTRSEQEKADEESDYDVVMQLQYLDMVINEVLRMYPVFEIIFRVSSQPTRVADLDLPAGVTIQPDVWTIHYDPEIWGEDAETFNPDRFHPENAAKRDPLSLLSFGAGPRMCFGRRFVLLHMKTLLCVLLRRFNLAPHPNGLGLDCLPHEMDTIDLDMVTPRQKIFVAFEPRDSSSQTR